MSFFFCFWFCSFSMKSFAFSLNSYAVKILLYSSLSSKSSKVNITFGWCGIFVFWLSIWEFVSCLYVETICIALCSIMARKTNKLFSVMALFPPISLATYRSHSMVSKILSMWFIIGLISLWFLTCIFFVSSKLFLLISKFCSSWSMYLSLWSSENISLGCERRSYLLS